MREIRTKLGYRILVGAGLLDGAGPRLAELGLAGKAVIITNPTVRGLYGDTVAGSLEQAGFRVTILEVPEGEAEKSLANSGRLYEVLTGAYAERTTPVLALGGGVIGDLAGFVAATYLRGLPLVHLPTTLLAQVDSSLGGKVAVNHGTLKNMVGAFYQPRLVIADTATLKTLPPAEVANGLAEVIKSAVIADGDFFAFLEANLDKIKLFDPLTLEETVARTAQIKVAVVEQDERDQGRRNTLNFGHTVGHGLEAAAGFRIGHGAAVAVGMVAAGEMAVRRGDFDRKELDRLKTLILRAGLPVSLPGADAGGVLRAMGHDKKTTGGKTRFVLPRRIGEVFITDDVGPALVNAIVGDICGAA